MLNNNQVLRSTTNCSDCFYQTILIIIVCIPIPSSYWEFVNHILEIKLVPLFRSKTKTVGKCVRKELLQNYVLQVNSTQYSYGLAYKVAN